MKVVSWNIGNFIWAKYLPGRKSYSFDRRDLGMVYEMIVKENPEVVFLQEVDREDVELLLQKFNFLPHSLIIESFDRESVSMFLSVYNITDIKQSKSHDYIINGITFFPIHLNAFSPEKRAKKVEELLLDLPSEKGVILGDTNFWIFKSHFIHALDKKSYKKICNGHRDILKDLGSTCRMYLALDKFFITHDILSSDEKITHHTVNHIDHYMISANIKSK